MNFFKFCISFIIVVYFVCQGSKIISRQNKTIEKIELDITEMKHELALHNAALLQLHSEDIYVNSIVNGTS